MYWIIRATIGCDCGSIGKVVGGKDADRGQLVTIVCEGVCGRGHKLVSLRRLPTG